MPRRWLLFSNAHGCGLTDIPQLATAWGECHVRRFDDFSGFCATYVAAIECIRTIADLDRLVLEVAEDAAESGATWIEPAGEWTELSSAEESISPSHRFCSATA